MKHTPGPWFVSSIKGDDGIMVGAGDGSDLVADVRLVLEAEQNAYLIAAAPELLEACKNALDSLRLHQAGKLDNVSTKALETAIAHALGHEWEFFSATIDNQGDPRYN